MGKTTDASKDKIELHIEDNPEKWGGKMTEIEGRFPCGHRKADWDNGYGDCVICQTKLFNNELEEELEKEKVRADRAEHDHEVALTLRDAMRERADKAEKCLESERISVNELSLANQELELRLKKLVEAVETVIDWISEVQCDDVGEIIKRLEKAIKNEEVNVDLKDYTPNLLVEQLSERIKELEAKLASIKADESIGKLVVECDCDHDGEFDAGQRHCRKCGEYLF